MKRILSILLVLALLVPTMAMAERNDELGYDYGLDVTFHSDKPISYSIMFSDNEAYPYQDDWLLWKAVAATTNVDIFEELTSIARVDFEDKKTILINSGVGPFIIPKTYEEGRFVAGGQVLAVSDYIKYMPNYCARVEEWGLEPDLMAIYQSDGKYYRLPGIKEVANGGYSFVVRKDVFEAAGIDMEASNTWTYEDFYAAMKQVKEYTGAEYVFSDRFTMNATLNISAVVYGVTAGWGKGNGMNFNWEDMSFYFADATDEMKAFLTYWHKLLDEKILDPESFSQEDDAALNKFYKGETFVISGTYQNMTDMKSKMLVDGAELYFLTTPGGPAGMLQIESSRLECGTMISTHALEELGEEGLAKMLRFVDWLWYSDEGGEMMRWGIPKGYWDKFDPEVLEELEINPEEDWTYIRTVNEDGTVTRTLRDTIYYNGINPEVMDGENPLQLNVDYGFSGGNWFYNDGPAELISSMMPEEQADWSVRQATYREPRKLNPPVMGDADQTDEMNLISTPLMDYVDTMTRKFIVGEADLNADWDAYLDECEAKGCYDYEDMCNDIWEDTKYIVGY